MTKTQLCEFDPILVEVVEKQLEPYRRLFSAELLAHMREEALVLLSTHPYPVALVEALRPREVTREESGTALKQGAQPAAELELRKGRTGGGRSA
jgi:hypothetical protein